MRTGTNYSGGETVYCLFSFPLGLSFTTILLLFFGPLGPGLLVRFPFVSQPQIERGCLLPFDFPRPPP